MISVRLRYAGELNFRLSLRSRHLEVGVPHVDKQHGAATTAIH